MSALPVKFDTVAQWLGLGGVAVDLPADRLTQVLDENTAFRQAWALAELALGVIDETEVHRRWPGLDIRAALQDQRMRALAERIAARRDVQQGALRTAITRLLPSITRAVERHAANPALGARAVRDVGELTLRLAALADKPDPTVPHERRVALIAGRAVVTTPEHPAGATIDLRAGGDVAALVRLLRLTDTHEVEALRGLLAEGTVGGEGVWPGW